MIVAVLRNRPDVKSVSSRHGTVEAHLANALISIHVRNAIAKVSIWKSQPFLSPDGEVDFNVYRDLVFESRLDDPSFWEFIKAPTY